MRPARPHHQGGNKNEKDVASLKGNYGTVKDVVDRFHHIAGVFPVFPTIYCDIWNFRGTKVLGRVRSSIVGHPRNPILAHLWPKDGLV